MLGVGGFGLASVRGPVTLGIVGVFPHQLVGETERIPLKIKCPRVRDRRKPGRRAPTNQDPADEVEEAETSKTAQTERRLGGQIAEAAPSKKLHFHLHAKLPVG